MVDDYREGGYYEETTYPESRVAVRGREGWLGILLAVLKRPWFIALSILIIFVPALFFIFSRPPLYRSRAIVSVKLGESSKITPLSSTEMAIESVGASEHYYLSILESRSFRNDVAHRLQERFPHLSLDSLQRMVKGRAITFERKLRAPGFIYLSAHSPDPIVASIICETALASFRSMSASLRRSDAATLLEFIEKQLEALNDKLGALEDDIQQFLREKRLTIDEVNVGVDSELRSLERSLAEAQAARDLARMQVDAYTQQLNQRLHDILAATQNTSDQTVINTLKRQLDDINTALNRSIKDSDTLNFHLLQTEKRKILNLMVSRYGEISSSTREATPPQVSVKTIEESLEKWMLDYESAQVRAMFYQTAINNFLKEHPNLSADLLEYLNLSRSREVLRKTIDILVEQRERIRLKMASESGGVNIIDPPTNPATPVDQRRGLKLAGVLVVALILGIALAYIVDLFDTTVQNEREVQTRFGLPVLGSIPVLSAHRFLPGRRRAHKKAKANIEDNSLDATHLDLYSESSPIAEAYRSVRTALLFTARDKNTNIFIITSPVAGDGKSINTYNLGVSLAQGGKKTLIIDTDLRRSSQHKIFGVERSPGITDVIGGDAKWEETIIPHHTLKNLWLIPAGSRVSNPAELVSSSQMKNFLDQLKGEFDIILMDTPPVTPCIDSRYLGMFTGGLIMMVRAESTKLSALDQSINLCRRVNVDIWGVIVNHASFRYGYGYYYVYQRYSPYGYYYSGYQYQYYYTTDEETGERIKKKRKIRRHQEEKT